MRTNNVQTLTYTNSFGEHNVNAMIGHEYYKTTTKYSPPQPPADSPPRFRKSTPSRPS